MKHFFLLLCLFSLFACSDFQRGNQLKQLDEQHARLLKMEQLIQSNDIGKTRAELDAAIRVDQTIKRYYENDTLSLPVAAKLDAFKEMVISLGAVVEQHPLLLSEMRDTKERITALHLDIEQGSGQREKYTESVNYETKKVAELAKLTDFYRMQLEKARMNYTQAYPFVQHFSEQLKKRN